MMLTVRGFPKLQQRQGIVHILSGNGFVGPCRSRPGVELFTGLQLRVDRQKGQAYCIDNLVRAVSAIRQGDRKC